MEKKDISPNGSVTLKTWLSRMTIETFDASFFSDNILNVKVGTEKSSNDHRWPTTYFKVEDGGNTCWKLRIINHEHEEIVVDAPRSVEIILEGDSELCAFIGALRMGYEYLRQYGSETYRVEQGEEETIYFKEQ